jgi:hypothetical protein
MRGLDRCLCTLQFLLYKSSAFISLYSRGRFKRSDIRSNSCQQNATVMSDAVSFGQRRSASPEALGHPRERLAQLYPVLESCLISRSRWVRFCRTTIAFSRGFSPSSSCSPSFLLGCLPFHPIVSGKRTSVNLSLTDNRRDVSLRFFLHWAPLVSVSSIYLAMSSARNTLFDSFERDAAA